MGRRKMGIHRRHRFRGRSYTPPKGPCPILRPGLSEFGTGFSLEDGADYRRPNRFSRPFSSRNHAICRCNVSTCAINSSRLTRRVGQCAPLDAVPSRLPKSLKHFQPFLFGPNKPAFRSGPANQLPRPTAVNFCVRYDDYHPRTAIRRLSAPLVSKSC